MNRCLTPAWHVLSSRVSRCCLSRRVLPGDHRRSSSAELGKANALVREGCYACLKEALAIFERLSAPPRPAPGASEGAFEATLLIAMREKELGIPADASLERAAAALRREQRNPKPKDQPPTIAPAVLLDAAELVIGETAGLDPEQRADFTGRNRPPLEPDNPQRRALDAWVDTDPVAQYVALTIDCEQPKLIESIKPRTILAKYAGRAADPVPSRRCAAGSARQAGAVREADPRLIDTLPWEARRALVGSQTEAIDLSKGAALFGQAHEAFPTSLAGDLSGRDRPVDRRVRIGARGFRFRAGRRADAS